MKKINVKDIRIIVDDFYSKLNGNIDCAQNLLRDAFYGMFENGSSSKGDFFKVGRFECYIGHSNFNREWLGQRKGFYIHFRDTKGIMTDFDKPLEEFLNIYANPEGYFILEAIAFQLQ